MGRARSEFDRFVLDQLAGIPELSSAPFFGGSGLRSGQTFFGMVWGGTLYFTTSPVTRSDYEALGSRCFSYVRKDGKVMSTKLFEVPAAVLDDQERLLEFAGRAIVAARQPRKPR